jgi:hypothetical protein
MNGFDVNSFCDSLDSYSVFDDVADSMDFAAVGIDTTAPSEELLAPVQKVAETNKIKSVKAPAFAMRTGKRGKKPGQKGICSVCKQVGHNKRTCNAL